MSNLKRRDTTYVMLFYHETRALGTSYTDHLRRTRGPCLVLAVVQNTSSLERHIVLILKDNLRIHCDLVITFCLYVTVFVVVGVFESHTSI